MAGPGEQAAERTDQGSRTASSSGKTNGSSGDGLAGLRASPTPFTNPFTGQTISSDEHAKLNARDINRSPTLGRSTAAGPGAGLSPALRQLLGLPPLPSPPAGQTTVPAGPGNATTADESMAAKYAAPPGVYDQATSAYRDRLLDKSNFNNSFLDNLGNMMAGSVGVGEMAPKFSTSNLSPNATWGLDPVQALLSAIGMGFPPAKIAGLGYQGAKMATGWDGPQIAMGDTSESFPSTPGAAAHTTPTTGFTAPGSQSANLGPGAGTGPGGAGATIPSATPTASQPTAAVPVQAAAAPAATTANPNQPGQRSPGGTIISGSNTVSWPWAATNGFG